MSRRLSLPHEHGAYLTIAASTAAGIAVAPRHAPALCVAIVIAAGFFARAPAEQIARGRAAPWDRAALGLLAMLAALSAANVGGWRAIVALCMGATIVTTSKLGRRARVLRTTLFESLAMAALGATAGAIAVGGGARWTPSAELALVLAVHAGTAVPLVRAEVRPRERDHAAGAARKALCTIVAAAALLGTLGATLLASALLPRGMHALLRMVIPAPSANATRVGLRETAMLGLVALFAAEVLAGIP